MSYSKSFYSLFIVFSFASTSSCYSSTNTTAHNKCSAEESQALILFKESLFSITDTSYDWKCSGYHSILMNWNTSSDCCYWEGVTCDHSTNDVIGLDLSCGMLSGIIHPNNTLFHLRHLQKLNLAYNYFTSEIPGEIGRLSNSLTHFNITDCWFSGQVPTEITHLHKLVSLDLSLNMYYFKLRPSVLNNLFLNLTNLEELTLEGINISSVLPTHLNISSSSSLKLLNLRDTTLQGNLPHSIFKLQSLETFDLSDNSFSGDIPWEISLLPKLVSLRLSMFNVIDNLRIQPHTFYSLLKNSTLLKDLSLSQVKIGSELPSFLNISSVRLLDLSYCGLRGFLPNSLVNLRHLTYLDLSANKFSGSVPSGLFTLPSLETFSLYDNMLSGNIPFESFALPALKSLDLSHNQFDGQIDLFKQGLIVQAFQQLTNLTRLDLSFNQFKGEWELETLLLSLTNLVELHLSYSGFSVITTNASHHVNPNFDILNLASCKLKVFPESLRAMKNLSCLDLSRNEIHGEIPLWAGEVGGIQLYTLDLSYNFITGFQQFQWYNLYYLYLQSNLIRGPFPLPICNISYLSFLDMSNNNFDGEVPQCFGNIISSLAMINLGNNRFHGTIPKVYTDCAGLEGLILNGNQLQGEIPSSLSKCRSLKVLDLGNNLLNGTFPIWLERLPNLQVLVLKSNKLHGIIETSSSIKQHFQSLRVLDLSHNGFSGQLPQRYFQNFVAMKMLKRGTKPEYLNVSDLYYSVTVTVKGQQLPFPKLSVEYVIVDLSSNKFEGGIPNEITSLTSLIVLNLSHNSLTGKIPHAVGNLTEIESLDLSCNKLTGEIPQSLVDMTFLEFLNLSQNNLVGRIPQGKQLSTFEGNSFGGNPKLCGTPLPIKCNEHTKEPQLENDGEDEDESGFTWEVVMLGYGFGTLVGLCLGYFMLSTGKPYWFVATAYAGERMILKKRNKRSNVYIRK